MFCKPTPTWQSTCQIQCRQPTSHAQFTASWAGPKKFSAQSAEYFLQKRPKMAKMSCLRPAGPSAWPQYVPSWLLSPQGRRGGSLLKRWRRRRAAQPSHGQVQTRPSVGCGMGCNFHRLPEMFQFLGTVVDLPPSVLPMFPPLHKTHALRLVLSFLGWKSRSGGEITFGP